MVSESNNALPVSGLTRAVLLVKRLIYWISRATNTIGAVLLMAMMFLVTADVILRSLLNKSLLGTVTFESIGFMMVVLVFFALAYCQIYKAHINIDMIIVHFPAIVQRIINSFMLFISLTFFCILTWQSIDKALYLRASNNISSALNIPTYPFLLVIAFGTALLALVLLVNFVETVKGGPLK
jgi:TRAP-type C4-dicarboxylate transport system permease small subunit